MGWHDRVDFASLVGKTIDSIADLGDTIEIHCNDGSHYRMMHIQDCCESVYVEDIVGNLDDITGSPILRAEERINIDEPKTHEWEMSDGSISYYTDESGTWTFYELATIKGSVTIRWYGSSNGYYSETVDFIHVNKPETRY